VPTTGHSKRRRIVIPFRALFKWLVRLRRSPRAIAGGFTLGIFIAFTPTIGFQIPLAILLATLLNLNRPAAILSVWVTNAATMAPIYTFNYWVGSLFLSGPPVSEVYKTFMNLAAEVIKIDIWEVYDQFKTVVALGTEIIGPLMLGSVIVGLVAAALTYLLSIALIHTFLKRRRARQLLNNP
jgi:uncharacterized protein (DUF2062 family)